MIEEEHARLAASFRQAQIQPVDIKAVVGLLTEVSAFLKVFPDSHVWLTLDGEIKDFVRGLAK